MYAIIKKIGYIYSEKVSVLVITAYLIFTLVICILYSINNDWEKNFYCNNEIFEKLESDVTYLVNNAGGINNIDINELEIRRIECLKNNGAKLSLYYPKDNIYIDVSENKNGIKVNVYKQIFEHIFIDFIVVPLSIMVFIFFILLIISLVLY